MTQTLYTTKQQVFDKVWKHFVIDKNPQSAAHTNEGTCLYAGTGCAIGCLVEDKAVCQKWDAYYEKGTPIGDIAYKFADDARSIFDFNTLPIGFLKRLQSAHDMWLAGGDKPFSEYIEKNLRAIAEDNSLEIPT